VTPTVGEGTTFRLPWAFDRSAFREAVRQEPVTREFVANFVGELLATVPAAMPFLKRLRTIEVTDSSRPRSFDRRPTRDKVTVTSDTGECYEWILLNGHFEEEAAALKSAHARVIEDARSAGVSVAVPLGEGGASGLLYATLPTREPSHLPLLINADFVPASDRKRIRFDDDSPVSQWNRQAIRTAAGLIAGNLERLAATVGDVAFVALLTSARDVSRRIDSERIEPAFAEFWARIETSIPSMSVVPAEGGHRGTPDTVRLWVDDAELAAAGLLEELGVRLVDRTVRAEWYGLRGAVTGLRNLTLGDLAGALSRQGLVNRWTQSEAPGTLADDRGLSLLWALLEFLLSVPDRSSQNSRQALLDCAIAPGWDSAMWPLGLVYRADQATQDLFADLNVDTAFLDEHRLEQAGQRLAALAVETTSSLALGWVEQVLLSGETDVSQEDRHRLLNWFFDRRTTLDESGLRQLANLPIFPTAVGARPLVGLALPGDFSDELGLAQLVDIDAVPDMGRFLAKLGAKTLDFSSYCTDFVPNAVSEGDLSDEARDRLLGVLARKFSEVQDNRQVREALRPLCLVPCRDRQWRTAEEVYLNPDVRAIVGDDIHLAAIPSINPSAHRDLFAWLGAASQPRPRDIETRCQQLRSGAVNHRSIAEAIMNFVGDCYAVDPVKALADFGGLREIPWLPAEGDAARRGHLPSSLYGTFRRALFATQAKFVDVSQRAQRDAEFLERWLSMPVEPNPTQVVNHLLESAKKSEPVSELVWGFLNQHANAPSLDALGGRACLLIADTGTYVKPDQVYWGEHPFGRYRHQLGPRFADYRALLERLRVRQHPDPIDAVDVLLDVAAHHGGEQAPLLTDDALVVNACWRLLSAGIEGKQVDPARLEELGSAEVVLDGRGWLSKPTDVFFRDAQTLADRFGPEVHDHLIDRPEGLWRALGAAGVRDLSDAVEARILEEESTRTGGVVVERLKTRRRLVLRVLAADDADAARKLSDFDGRVRLVRLSRLVIDQALELGGAIHRTQAFERGALYRNDIKALLYVEAAQPASWVELARELTRAIDIDGYRAPDVAAALRGVLAADTDEEARRDLDELGFRALDETSTAQAEPTVASGLGGAPTTEEGEQGTERSDPTDAVERDTAECVNPPGSQSDREADSASGKQTGDSGVDGGSAPSDAAAHPSDTGSSGQAAAGASESRERDASAAQTQSRLRSYVTPKGRNGQAPHDGSDDDEEVERAGVAAVMDYEFERGRIPEEMPPLNPGFDVQSVDSEERVRYIEVKSTADVWGARGVAMSSMQFDTALKKREDFWLYVVENALSNPRVDPINDPASKVDQFFFDDGWRVVVEIEEVERPPFEAIDLIAAADAPSDAVPFFDAANTSPGVPAAADGWIVWNGDGRSPTADTFAVRIAGYALGLSFYGGAALVEPLDRVPDDYELVYVELHDQLDPDSRSARSLRRWTPERDLTGTQLGLRLSTDGSVEPLTVTSPDDIVVLGAVRATARPSDLRGGDKR
jgi:hypothetical protein